MRSDLSLNFGPRTLSRIYCDACKEETLHVRGVCNHCAPSQPHAGSARVAPSRVRALKAESPWRADHDATCRARLHARDRER